MGEWSRVCRDCGIERIGALSVINKMTGFVVKEIEKAISVR